MRTRFTELFGLAHPIMQAPMASVAGPELAGAVASAGGLGMLPTGTGADPAVLQQQVARVRDLTQGPFGIGFMVWALPQQAELLAASLETKPDAILLSFGDPRPFADRIKRYGIRLICQVQTVDAAREAQSAGADLIVAQGTEAGGHTGGVGTLALLPQVLDAVPGIPVLAAGGIADGRGLAAALIMGADGVSIGTRFVASHESLSSAAAKNRVVQARETDTVLTRVFDLTQGLAWPAEFPGRALRNRFTDRWHGRETELAAHRDEARRELEKARQAQDFDTHYVYAGQVSGLIASPRPAGQLVQEISAHAEHLLRHRPLACL